MNLWQKAKLLFNNSAWDEGNRAFVRGDDIPVISGQVPVTTSSAMKYSALFACVRVLSETLAAMPAMLYRKGKDGDRQQVNDLAIYDILHNSPNDEMSPFSFKETCMISLNTGGNAVCERLVNANGGLLGLYPYPWNAVRIERDKDNRLIYKVREGNNERILTRQQVFHLPGMSLDGVIGLSPIEYAASAIRLGLNYQAYGNKLYENGVNPSGAFTHPNAMSDAAFARLKDELTKNYTGMANLGKPLILEEGMTFSQFTIKPADAQMIENKRFQTEDIARIYRVPLHLINDLAHATFSNIEMQSLEFVMFTMLPWFRRWEQGINQQLLTPKERKDGYYVEFKVDSLLRGDSKSRAEAYATGRTAGYLSVNDIRRLENMNSITNGDVYLQPLNMVDVNIANEVQTNKQTDATKAMTDEIHQMIINEGR